MVNRPKGPLGAARILLALSALVAALVVAPSAASAGTLIADNGFRPQPNGFSFPNYGNELELTQEKVANLDADDMVRMYGPGVCAKGNGASCVLTPIAEEYMIALNTVSEGGHCFGLATLAELIYKGDLPRFGFQTLGALTPGAQTTFELGIERNKVLQHAIARAFISQVFESTVEGTITGTPTKILNTLLHGALDPKNPQIWTFTIAQWGGKGGHAITPYAVEKVGPNEYGVLVYDNNWPSDNTRRLFINTKADTWNYYAATSPSVAESTYEGDAKSKTLALAPVTPALVTQPCFFCAGTPGAKSKYNEIRLSGTAAEHAQLLIVDDKGRRTGFVGHRLLNQIPGAKILVGTSGGTKPGPNGGLWKDSPAPVIKVPKDVEFAIHIDGSELKVPDHETLGLIGPTYDGAVENLVMGPGQEAVVELSPKGNAISYTPSAKTVSPAINIGTESKADFFRLNVASVHAPKRSSLILVKEPKHELLWFGDETKQARTYQVKLNAFDHEANEVAFVPRTVTIKGNQQAYIDYGTLDKKGVALLSIYTPGHKKHPVKVIKLKPKK